MYIQRINKVQEYLKNNNIDGFIFFISDDHGSEYITNTYKSVAFLSGFTGSAGTLLITKESSYLWTDGRYFLQASEQLKKSNTILKKIGEDETIIEYISTNLNSLAVDFKTLNTSFANALNNSKTKLVHEEKLLDEIWTNRPKLSKKKISVLPDSAVHMSANKKCYKTLSAIKKKDNYGVLITALDDIAYLTNARGKDIKYNPVFNSFMLLTRVNGIDTYTLYISSTKLSMEAKDKLKEQGIIIKPYNQVYKDVKVFKHKIYFSPSKTNFLLYTLMENKKAIELWPTLNKAIKRKVEIIDSKKAHIKDAVAMCKFIYYIKNNVGKRKIDELSASKYLANLRKSVGAHDLSFSTICGYKEHGAIIHYSASKESNKQILNDGLLLVDSGGQYYYGTTDITRTIALNNITDKMKYHFTLVLKAHIALSCAIFDKKTTDASLDLIARKPLWDAGLDYNHGTGHGVGHNLNVHEGPQSIRHNKVNPTFMKKGMITSNEPGLYFENEYGIRHENELLCVKVDKDHLGFEPITYVPFDVDAIDVNMLTDSERKWLNNYHQLVYNIVSKYLTIKEKEYLRKITKEI